MSETLLDLARKVRIGVGKVGLLPEHRPKVPAEKINEAIVSQTIAGHLIGPLRANRFTIADVMANMGYVPLSKGADFKEKFPQEYKATRGTLTVLV